MLKKSTNYLNLISLLILIYLAFIPLKPSNSNEMTVVSNSFSMALATDHIKKISQEPHSIGTAAHERARDYIVKELQKLGLIVKIQKTTISSHNQAQKKVQKQKTGKQFKKDKTVYNTFAQVENIFARIQGTEKNRKALLLLAHYDSVANASYGAGDDATGVAVILEGIRAYLSENNKPKNDIIILISDAEEIGLFGAKAFAEKHAWTKDIGAVINFEARGTSGPSYMFMETNSGNHNMLEQFNQAGVSYANSNSMAYSIYKMLPNDTDMTIFRRDKDILGFNFAFIDSHFNYHTARDNYQNLSLDSVAHQAHYLMPMLRKLSQINLSDLKSNTDDVYFQVPFWKTLSYPFTAAFTLSLLVLSLFIVSLIIGIKNKSIRIKQSLTAGIVLIKSMTISAVATFGILKFLYFFHPQFSEIYQGFTYNGHAYVVFFTLLTLSICFLFYRNIVSTHTATEIMVIPTLLWIILSFVFAHKLTGAHFFLLIGFAGSLSLLINVLMKKPQSSLTLLLFAPIILIFSPFFQQLPVALGLMVLPFSGLLLILLFAPLIVSIQIPKEYQINKWVFIIALFASFTYAEMHASTSKLRPLPDSLYYFQDNASQSAYWFSADSTTDKWNSQFLDKDILKPQEKTEFKNNNWRGAQFVSYAKFHDFPISSITLLKDRSYVDKHVYRFKITNKRKVTRMDLRTLDSLNILKLSINREDVISQEQAVALEKNSRLVKIFTGNSYEFIVEIEIQADQKLNLSLLEMSDDLLQSKQLNIPKRPDDIIAKPFIFSDMIITKQLISP